MYITIATVLSGGAYLGYKAYFPAKKRRSGKPRTAKPKVPAATTHDTPSLVAATTGGAYEEEWIPTHHLKTRKSSRKAGDATSGDEKSGHESGVERRRSTRGQ